MGIRFQEVWPADCESGTVRSWHYAALDRDALRMDVLMARADVVLAAPVFRPAGLEDLAAGGGKSFLAVSVADEAVRLSLLGPGNPS